jgi:hypothetical protein
MRFGLRCRALGRPIIDHRDGWAAGLRKQAASCIFRQCLKPHERDDTGCGVVLIG